MNLSTLIVLGVALVIFPSGPSFGLTEEQKAAMEQVKIMKSDPPAECKELGTVNASGDWCRGECQKKKLRKKTAKMGGNYIRLDGDGYLLGTSFKCPY